MPHEIDLKELTRRGAQEDRAVIAPPRRLLTRYVLPAALGLGFLVLLAWTGRETYLPRTPVTIVPVHVSRAEVQTAGTPLFKAAGWVEPRPTPVRVAALAPGVVEELLVVEDEFVEQGQTIARLVDEDAVLALDQAEATLRLRQAEVQAAEAGLQAARTNLEIPAHLELPVAEAEAALAAIDTELSNLPKQLERAKARLRLAQIDLQAKQRAGSALSGLLVEQSQSELDSAQAEADELTLRQPVLQQQRNALARRRDAAARRLELVTDEKLALGEAEAALAAARAQVTSAEVAVAEARLRLSRMTIPAPRSGRVLNLVAAPGSQLMTGPSAMQDRDSSTVVTMYSPERLQVRVDVRFEDLPRVGRGHPVLIESPALAEPQLGTVLFLTGFANIQKNTLEVKVSLDDPPPVMKPEMLVDVTFVAPPQERSADESREEYRLFVPRQLVEAEGAAHFVWTADIAERVARRRRIELGPVQTPEYLEVVQGVTAGSRVIASGRENLKEGDRIEIRGEDPSIGIQPMSATPAAPATAAAQSREHP